MAVHEFFSFIVCWAFVPLLIPLPLIPDLIVGVLHCVITEGTLITKLVILSSYNNRWV